uniref:Ig-like domain-containing protein n=1 Tax=Acrobeloides nanus TaxID=290746 RepID=A0A914CTH0_9BILA
MILLTTLDNKEVESKNSKHLSSTTSSLRNQAIKTTPLSTEVKQLTQFIESINIPSTHKPLEFTKIAVEFIAPAKVIETPTEQYATDEYEAQIWCNLKGDEITIEWLKNGILLQANSKYDFKDEVQTLIISKFSQEDVDVYTCRWTQFKDMGTIDINVKFCNAVKHKR